jgi:hypothetical protein
MSSPLWKRGAGGIRFCSSSRAKARQKRIPRAVAFRILRLRRALTPFYKVGTGLLASFEAKWTLRAISNEFSFELGWPGIRFLLKPSGSKKQKRIPRAVASRILRLRRALAPFCKVGTGLLASLFEARADSLGSPKCALLIAKVPTALLALFEGGCAHPV